MVHKLLLALIVVGLFAVAYELDRIVFRIDSFAHMWTHSPTPADEALWTPPRSESRPRRVR